MKIKVNDQPLFELSETQKKVICNEISHDMLEDDLKRRLQWVLTHKYEQCLDRLKKEWLPKLAANGVESIPMNNDALAELIFAQPQYMDRKARNAQEEIDRK